MSTHGCTGNPCVICFPPNTCAVTHEYYSVPLVCQCPGAWWGTVSPYCPVHNPGYATATIQLYPQGVPLTPGLSPEDIEKIARRVAELLKGG